MGKNSEIKMNKKDYKNFLEKVDDMLSKALDVEETDYEESLDLLYEILDLIRKEKEKLNG